MRRAVLCLPTIAAGERYGGAGRALRHADVRSAKRLQLAGYGCQIGYPHNA